jgi:hypothetical protein
VPLPFSKLGISVFAGELRMTIDQEPATGGEKGSFLRWL